MAAKSKARSPNTQRDSTTENMAQSESHAQKLGRPSILQHVLGNANITSLLIGERARSGHVQRTYCGGCPTGGPSEDEIRPRAVKGEQRDVIGPNEGLLSEAITQSIEGSRTSGAPVDSTFRTHMEASFGTDFSGVRLHSDAEAAHLNQQLGARAFTSGSDIFLGRGASSSDHRTLAHELTHVVQQRSMEQRGGLRVGPEGDTYEREADAVAADVVSREASLPAKRLGRSQAPLKTIAPARTVQRDAGSDDYRQGYQDGLNGDVSLAGPRTPDALADYDEGYAKGHYEFSQQSSSGSTQEPNSSQGAPSAAGDGATHLEEQYRSWLAEHNWPQVAESLNGFNSADIQKRLADLTPEDVANIHQGALDNPRVGPESQVALMTKFSQQLPSGSSTLSPTDTRPEEAPASGIYRGLPAFRFNLPKSEIESAATTIETPEATIHLALFLRGSVTATFPNPQPLSLDFDTEKGWGGWRVAATQALGPLTAGVRVNGLGTGKPSIGVTLGSDYNVTECRFEPPNSMLFIGQDRVDYSQPSAIPILGQVAVLGQLGFELRVTVTPHPSPLQPSPEYTSQEDWFEANAAWLAAVGVGAITLSAILLAPETGGASLLVLAPAI